MQKTIALAIAIVITTGLTGAHAIDGKLMYQMCAKEEPELLTYVSGVVETLMESEDDIGLSVDACVPGGTTVADVRDKTCEYLTNTVEARHQRGAQVVLGSLKHGYPCP